MARPKSRPEETVADRIDRALAVTRGGLKLWIVFEDDAQVREARALIQAKKARHLTALSRADMEKRHAKAYREVAGRYGAFEAPEEAPMPASAAG